MSEEHGEQDRDASAATDGPRTDQYPIPSYTSAAHELGRCAPTAGPSTASQAGPPGQFNGLPMLPAAPPPRQQRAMVGVVTAAVVAGVFAGGAGFAGAYALLAGEGLGSALTSSQQAPEVTAAPGTVSAAAQVVLPSTVDVRATQTQGVSAGTGVVVTAEGDILTNNHVIAGGAEITVTLADGTERAATVVGTSPSYDLAVIRLQNASGVTPATLGESSPLQVGQPVVAIGSPRGLAGTVTSGIVSALDRTVTVAGEDGTAVAYTGLQTDAPINHGNSGGPLVNLDGQVVGINSAIETAGGQESGSIGLGFAIPVDQARRVAQEIMDSGTATKPVLGVQGSIDAGTRGGAPIAGVQPGSPAEAAGLQTGDVVTRVDDAPVATYADLMARIGAYAPGEQVTLTVTNGGADRTSEVTLGSQPDQAATTSPTEPSNRSQTPFGQGNPFNPFGGRN